jgi:undecaprenyl-diphosphatase
MNVFEAIILGILQGLTEFLPISSSGHLELGKHLFGINPEASFYFTVAVHGATVCSTLVVFWKEIAALTSGVLKFRLNEETKYLIKIIISMIPVGLVGILLKDKVEAFFNGNIVFVGAMLLLTALILLLSQLLRRTERPLSYPDAFIIGLAQAFAVLPGLSRSGSTIATGLLLGNGKDEIARFSFLMVIIPVLGANLLEVMSFESSAADGGGYGILLAGFISAFIAGYFACKWMIGLVRKSKLVWFAGYCTLVGILAILLG